MQVTQTHAEGLKREYRISVPGPDIEGKVTGRLDELRRTVSIPGFRPGRAPFLLLKKRFGDAVRGEVLEAALQDSTREAIDGEGVRPALQPRIDDVNFADGEDLEYTLAVELMPDIEPIDFSDLELERLVVEPSEEAVSEAVARLARQRTVYTAVADGRGAVEGDRLRVDFKGRIDGEEFPGGTAEDFVLDLGAGVLVAGFDEQLIGVASGGEKTVEVTFPDDYPAEHLKGRTASFEVLVKAIEAAAAPEIDDEFAAGLGSPDLAALQASIKERIAREYAEMSKTLLKRNLLDKLAGIYDFELPPTMVESEFDGLWKRVEELIAGDRLGDEDKGLTEDELKARYRGIAERRVRLGLLLSEIGRLNEIRVGEDELQRAVTAQAFRFPGQEQKVAEYYRNNPAAVMELQAPILEDKVVDFIVELARVTERQAGPKDLILPETAGSG